MDLRVGFWSCGTRDLILGHVNLWDGLYRVHSLTRSFLSVSSLVGVIVRRGFCLLSTAFERSVIELLERDWVVGAWLFWRSVMNLEGSRLLEDTSKCKTTKCKKPGPFFSLCLESLSLDFPYKRFAAQFISFFISHNVNTPWCMWKNPGEWTHMWMLWVRCFKCARTVLRVLRASCQLPCNNCCSIYGSTPLQFKVNQIDNYNK